MKENYFVAARREAIKKLLTFAMENKDLEKKQVIARFSFKTGYAPSRVEQYFEELVDLGFVELTDGNHFKVL